MDFDTLLTDENIAYAVFAVIAVVVAFILIKKLAGCLIRTVVFLLLLAALAYLYLNYIDKGDDAGDDKPLMEVHVTNSEG